MMHRILRPHRRNAIVYLDDVLIFSRTLAEHKKHVEDVLQMLRRARLRLNEVKCVFGTLETSLVGSRVNRHAIHIEETKVKAVRDWATPRTPTELRGFLGLAGYCRKFVRKFAHRAHLLHELAAKPRNEYVWTECHRDQFEDVKQALTSAPVLATLDPDTDFILRTDASDTAIGGVLAQRQLFEGRMVERPLGYFSRKLHAVESRYPAYDRELLAISANLEHWACYVHGPFQVGNEVFLDTLLLPVGYANVTEAANDSNNSCKNQHPYAGPFRLLKKVCKNAFVLDIRAHWRLHPVFNVSRLKP
jgi:hypothetical protein